MQDNHEIVWVTGASKGIGFACAKALADSGRRVVMSSRNRPELIHATTEIRRSGGNAVAVQCDVSNEEDRSRAFLSGP